MLCATMAVTTTMGVDLGFSWVFLGVFPFDFLSYSCYRENQKELEKDVLCATMTMAVTVGVDLGFSWGVSF